VDAAQLARRAAEQLLEGLVEAPHAAEPDARATSAIGSRVSWISCLASSTRRVWATDTGGGAEVLAEQRRSWRSPTPNRPASASTSPVSIAPPSIRASARLTVLEVPRQAPRSGEASGRQRRQGR
jgi:hypothetical protein